MLTSPLNLLGGIFSALLSMVLGMTRVRGTGDGGGGNHGKITERQLDITKDPHFAAISPFLCCSPRAPARTTVFIQHKTVNVLFAGLCYYQPAKVCEEAFQTYPVFVLCFPHRAPGNRSLLPPWKLLLILITLLLGILQLPSNTTLKSTALDLLKDRIPPSCKLAPTGTHHSLHHTVHEPGIQRTLSRATPCLCLVKEVLKMVQGKGGLSCCTVGNSMGCRRREELVFSSTSLAQFRRANRHCWCKNGSMLLMLSSMCQWVYAVLK